MAEKNLVTFDLNDPRAALKMRTKIEIAHPLPSPNRPVAETVLKIEDLGRMAVKLKLPRSGAAQFSNDVRRSLKLSRRFPLKVKYLLDDQCRQQAAGRARGFEKPQELRDFDTLRNGILAHYGLLEKAAASVA